MDQGTISPARWTCLATPYSLPVSALRNYRQLLLYVTFVSPFSPSTIHPHVEEVDLVFLYLQNSSPVFHQTENLQNDGQNVYIFTADCQSDGHGSNGCLALANPTRTAG